MKARPGLWRAYRMPALLAAVSVAGLVSALVEDGPFDAASWLLLGTVVVALRPSLKR